MTESRRIREARVRRLAARLGVDVAKANDSAASSPGGGYMIVEPQTQAVIFDGQSGAYSLTLDDVEAYLGDPDWARAIPVSNMNAANDR